MRPASELEYALLGLLRQGPRSGYDLRKQFAATPIGHYSDSPGSIYPALRRLQARRWVAEVNEDGGPRNRQRFALTREGERALRRWIAAPVTRADVIWSMDQVMLRFAFLDQTVGKAQTLAFLDQLEGALAGYVEELKSYLAKAGPELASATGRLAMESGIEGYEASLAWTRRARMQLSEMRDETFVDMENVALHSDLRRGRRTGRDAGDRPRAPHAGAPVRR